MSVFNNNLLMGAAGASGGGGGGNFDPTIIPNSVWMDGSSDGFTIASGSMSDQDGKEFTLGTWFQLTEFGVTGAIFCAGDSSAYTSFRHGADDKLFFQTKVGDAILSTSNVFRDLGWYHMLLSVDTTQVVSSNRVRLFINGIENVLTGTQPAQDRVYDFNKQEEHEIGNSVENGAFEGYLCQSFMIGSKSIQQGDFAITDFLDSFTFGTNGSQFAPKSSTDILTLVDAGSSNSFLLKYENSGSLGLDSSTNTNNFTATDMGSANQSTNTSSKTFSIFNPLANGDQTQSELGSFSVSDGNQTLSLSSSNQWLKTTVPFVMSGSNIIRTQFTIDTVGNTGVGITGSPHSAGTYHTFALGIPGQGEVALLSDGAVVVDGQFGSSGGYTSSWSNGDVIDVIVNLDVGAVWFALNGTLGGGATQSEIQAGTTTNAALVTSFVRRTAGEVFNFYALQWNASATTVTYNSGHSAFSHSYSTITSLVPLSTADLAAPDFQGIDYFDSTLYTGNGGNQRVGDFVPFTDTFAIDNSVMFDDADRRYLALTYTSGDEARSSNSQATISYWIKFIDNGAIQEIISTSNSAQTERLRHYIDPTTSGGVILMTLDPPGGANNRDFTIPISYLSTTTWTHVCYNIDVDNGTAADKIKCFINGVQVTSSTTTYQSASNSDYFLFNNEEHCIANLAPTSAGHTAFCNNSYLAEFNALDGQLKAPTDFGQVDTSTNRWIPKDYKTDVGTYGNRGFRLDFENATGTGDGVGTDSSGNGFNFTESVISGGSAWATSDQFIDTPSANFSTIYRPNNITAGTVSEGNTKLVGASDSMLAVGWSENNLAIPSGKWFMEFATGTTTGGNISWGMSNIESIAQFGYVGQQAGQAGFTFSGSGATVDMYQNGSSTGSANIALGFTFATADVGVIAYDANNKEMWMGFWDAGSSSQITWINGDFSATTTFPSTNPTFNIADQDNPTFAIYANASPRFVSVNTGSQMVFNGAATTLNTDANGRFLSAAAIPTDFKAVNVDNLDDTASKLTAWAWIKNRDATDNHMLFDRVRGVGNDWHSNDTAAEVFNANTLQRFLQRGVQIGDDAEVNTDNEAYVLWQWLVGDSATTGSTNEEGSIDSTLIVADHGGFSIGTYTGTGAGATVGHGLSAAPELIFIKDLDSTTECLVWSEYTKSSARAGDGFGFLSSPNAFFDNGPNSYFADTDPNATIITMNGSTFNTLSKIYNLICFRSIAGVCKVGGYEGNGVANGSYIYTGFKPAWVMFKSKDSTSDWQIFDSKRNGFNVRNNELEANDTAAEDTSTNFLDLLSDGFKLRIATDPNVAETFMYIAMADLGGNGTLPPIYGR